MNDGSVPQMPGVDQGGQGGQQTGPVLGGQPGALPPFGGLASNELDAEMTGHMALGQTVQAPEGTNSLERAVSLASGIVNRTQNNPSQQARELSALKANYLKEGHGVDLNTPK